MSNQPTRLWDEQKFDEMFPAVECSAHERTSSSLCICEELPDINEERNNIKSFFDSEAERIVQQIKGEVELLRVEDSEHTTACHYKRKGCDCGKLERMVYNKALNNVQALIHNLLDSARLKHEEV